MAMRRAFACCATLAVLAAALLGGGAAGAASVVDPLERPALALRTPGKGMLLALASTGGDKPRLVAAGERGIIVLSDNGGISWRQAKVPVAVTLTALAFPAPNLGWAVGHGGVVLHSADGGETWVKQFDGIAAARSADEAARSSGDAALQKRTAQLVADGADKPFMAVHFADHRRGFIVGAYGLIFGTENGGASWLPWLDRVDNPKGLHLNAVAADGDVLYLAGEQGLLLRSDDGGRRFSRLNSPYPGSFFAAAAGEGALVVAGLKGNAFRSDDRGASFSRIDGTAPVNIINGRRLDDGRLLLINQAGQLLASNDRGRSLQTLALPPGAPALAALPLADGTWIVAGPRGVARTSSAP
jgi:photosystem II stability/assembly factor-like uncharacterized protein